MKYNILGRTNEVNFSFYKNNRTKKEKRVFNVNYRFQKQKNQKRLHY